MTDIATKLYREAVGANRTRLSVTDFMDEVNAAVDRAQAGVGPNDSSPSTVNFMLAAHRQSVIAEFRHPVCKDRRR